MMPSRELTRCGLSKSCCDAEEQMAQVQSARCRPSIRSVLARDIARAVAGRLEGEIGIPQVWVEVANGQQ